MTVIATLAVNAQDRQLHVLDTSNHTLLFVSVAADAGHVSLSGVGTPETLLGTFLSHC